MTPAERRSYIKKNPLAYGGQLRCSRAGRTGARPIANGQTMHLVLRASCAKGAMSFRHPRNAHKIQQIVNRFSAKYRVKIHSLANVGNHLHFHAQLQDYNGYAPFIRAVTAAIAMAIAGTSRWKKAEEKFWDYRPFTRVVVCKPAYFRLANYVKINILEGRGHTRTAARWLIAKERVGSG